MLVKKLKAKGMMVNGVKDPKAFRSKVLPVYEKFRSSIGDKILDAVLEAVK